MAKAINYCKVISIQLNKFKLKKKRKENFHDFMEGEPVGEAFERVCVHVYRSRQEY